MGVTIKRHTPNSVRSNWLYFESGYAYSKGLRVVPVGFLGTDLSSVPPPLSLLQGFNVVSEAGLGNIVAVVNEVFGHKHPEAFSSEDFRNLSIGANAGAGTQLGKNTQTVLQIIIEIDQQSLINVDASESLKAFAAHLSSAERESVVTEGNVELIGVIYIVKLIVGGGGVEIRIDPTVIEDAIPYLQPTTAIRLIRKDGLMGQRIQIQFVEGVHAVWERHIQTGALFGTEGKLSTGSKLSFRNLEFSLDQGYVRRGRGINVIEVELRTTEDDLSLPNIRDLLDLLFARDILYLR